MTTLILLYRNPATSPSVSPAVVHTILDGSDYTNQQLPQFTFYDRVPLTAPWTLCEHGAHVWGDMWLFLDLDTVF